jgi:hypothetical protein
MVVTGMRATSTIALFGSHITAASSMVAALFTVGLLSQDTAAVAGGFITVRLRPAVRIGGIVIAYVAAGTEI